MSNLLWGVSAPAYTNMRLVRGRLCFLRSFFVCSSFLDGLNRVVSAPFGMMCILLGGMPRLCSICFSVSFTVMIMLA